MKIYVVSTGYIDKFYSQEYCVEGYFKEKEDAFNYLQNKDWDLDDFESFHDRNVWWWEVRDEFERTVVVAIISEEKLK